MDRGPLIQSLAIHARTVGLFAERQPEGSTAIQLLMQKPMVIYKCYQSSWKRAGCRNADVF